DEARALGTYGAGEHRCTRSGQTARELSAYLTSACSDPQRRAPALAYSRSAIPIPKPPVLWPDLLGRSQLSAAPDFLLQCKKRPFVTAVTESAGLTGAR